jgi:CBS domain-containing protein
MEPQIRTRVLVREVMNSPLITASPNEGVKSIAKKMQKYNIGSIIVQEKEKPLGIVTERDIIRKGIAKKMDLNKLTVKQIMSKPLQTIDDDKDITEAAKLMRNLRIRKLGVNYKKRLVGIISIFDLISVTPELIGLISEKTRIMTGEPRKRVGGHLSGYCDVCKEWSDLLIESDGKFECDECREGRKKR